MRILFADAFAADHLPELEALGYQPDMRPDLGPDELASAIPGFEALVVRSTRVTAAALDAADRLGLIIRAGAGVNTIDVEAAAQRGVYVCNVPGRNAIAVAELAFGLLLAIDRQIPDAVADLRSGRWRKKAYAKARGLHGRSVGVVGLGRIGLEFAERAVAFGMHVLAVAKPDRAPHSAERAADLGIEFVADLDTLARRCDILTFHVPAGPQTKGLIGRQLLDVVKPGAWIINTSRADIVDDAALLAAMDAKGVRAGIDVFREEPSSGEGEIDSPLARHPNVYGTHHIGASTEQAQSAIAAEVVRMLRAYAAGEVRHCVNLETKPLGVTALVVRHRDEVGVLSDVLAVLRKANLNVEQMDNRVFAGAQAACATIHVSGAVPEDLRWQLARIDHVLHVDARPHAPGEGE
ncbi:MAG TPA: NAD(P)-dependent oxidoreductase [Egibacteraceae bacterium]|nr:NAD(P)-dependent oxidoreductase [Egibacteraceae bacterium]